VLAQSGARVAIVEKAAFPRRKVCGEFISATTWPLLRDLDVARRLPTDPARGIRRVGLFARDVMREAPMPRGDSGAWGMAVGRDILDAAIVEAAVEAGAARLQPCAATGVEELADGCRVTVGQRTIDAAVVVAAPGSWHLMRTHREGDLLGFKARFRGATLAHDLMPLVLFPGGYGGLVTTDGGAVSFSLCIRRDALRHCRERHRGVAAGEAVLAHVMETCRGVREALAGARLEAPWLAAGPIRPGIRQAVRGRIFTVGNAAGEAHPLVAEGIGMAIQSGWLAARCLADSGTATRAAIERAASRYEAAWRDNFAARIRASQLFARLTTRPATTGLSIAVLRALPSILSWGARASGKARAPRLYPEVP
jgi:flavin-dependent dehydrogenase